MIDSDQESWLIVIEVLIDPDWGVVDSEQESWLIWIDTIFDSDKWSWLLGI